MVYSQVQKTSSHRQQTLSRKFPWYIVYGHNNWYTYEKMYQWNNTRIGKYKTFHIHVKNKHGYSSKYTEHVFSVIGVNMPRLGLDHKLRQITNCDDSVAICDCRNLWRFKIQLFRLMSIVPEGILLNAERMFTSTSDPIKKVSFVHRLWAL